MEENTISKSHHIYDLFFKVVEYASAVFLFCMVIICATNVFMRYVMHHALRWGDEMSLFCMIWYSMLSASVALKENRHIRVGIWDGILGKKANQILQLVVYIITIAVIGIMMFYSYKLTGLAGRTKMTGSGLPLAWEYVSLPVCSVLMLIASIGRVGEIFGWK